jgi:hypothetical protein
MFFIFFEGFQSLAGRPVLMVGTLAMAFLKAVSAMPDRACRPARISSLFLTSTPKAMARFFISVICSSSVLGRVKLSRTTLTFFSLATLAGAAAFFLLAVLACGALAGLVLALVGAAGEAGGLTGAAMALNGLRLGAGLALLRGALTGILEVGTAFEAALAEALAAGLAAGCSVRAGVDVVALGTAGVDASLMENSLKKINGAYSLYR